MQIELIQLQRQQQLNTGNTSSQHSMSLRSWQFIQSEVFKEYSCVQVNFSKEHDIENQISLTISA